MSYPSFELLQSVHDEFARTLIEHHPMDTARVLERLEPRSARAVLQTLDESYQAQTLEGFSPDFAARVLLELEPTERLELVRELPSEVAVDIFDYLPEREVDTLLEALPSLHAEELETLGDYEDETAGSIMSPEFVSLRIGATVADALTRLRRLALIGQNVTYVYVVEQEVLRGVLMMRDLVLNPPETPLADIMIKNVVRVYTSDDLGDVADLLRERQLLAVPVVDDSERVQGVVLATQLVSELQEEGFEDAQKMFGAGSDEHASSTPFFAIRKRLPWLNVNLVTAFLAAATVGAFEGVIAQITILAAFLPVVAGQGGNAGAQALAVMLRSLAFEEVDIGKPRRVLSKEAFVGLVNGLQTGLVAGVAAALFSGNVALGLVIFAAMTVNLVVAGVAGAAIPLVMERLGQDPAQSSNIILTTITDVFGFASFLGLAVLARDYLIA
ncbi:MAG: magnesium transporter [Trueperaceae bacterium]|nr:magnesium transporter [Trueperaceae bacterium]